jgi:hypothetical protein
MSPAERCDTPLQLAAAALLLWIGWLLAAGLALAFAGNQVPASAYADCITAVSALALLAVIIVGVQRRRNWARYALAGALLLLLVLLLLNGDSLAPMRGVIRMFGRAGLMLGCIAAILLFTEPGASWFRS